jgi:hypothetical protein
MGRRAEAEQADVATLAGGPCDSTPWRPPIQCSTDTASDGNGAKSPGVLNLFWTQSDVYSGASMVNTILFLT